MAHPLALPKTFSPDALDTTAELAAILARVQPPPSSSSAAAAAAGPGSGSGATPQPGGTGDAAATASGAGAGAGAGAISLRDLPTATDRLKHKLQHARAQIKTLPDVGRSVAAQEAEMRQLEARIEAQQAMLARLREEAARFAAGEQEQAAAPGDKMEL